MTLNVCILILVSPLGGLWISKNPSRADSFKESDLFFTTHVLCLRAYYIASWPPYAYKHTGRRIEAFHRYISSKKEFNRGVLCSPPKFGHRPS